jgi:hypothetical protein
MTAENVANEDVAEDECRDCGYEPDLLRTAWPIGIWLWILAAVGQALVALVVTAGDATIPASIVVGLTLAGGAYFAYMMIFHPQDLDTEPGDDPSIAIDSEVPA